MFHKVQQWYNSISTLSNSEQFENFLQFFIQSTWPSFCNYKYNICTGKLVLVKTRRKTFILYFLQISFFLQTIYEFFAVVKYRNNIIRLALHSCYAVVFFGAYWFNKVYLSNELGLLKFLNRTYHFNQSSFPRVQLNFLTFRIVKLTLKMFLIMCTNLILFINIALGEKGTFLTPFLTWASFQLLNTQYGSFYYYMLKAFGILIELIIGNLCVQIWMGSVLLVGWYWYTILKHLKNNRYKNHWESKFSFYRKLQVLHQEFLSIFRHTILPLLIYLSVTLSILLNYCTFRLLHTNHYLILGVFLEASIIFIIYLIVVYPIACQVHVLSNSFFGTNNSENRWIVSCYPLCIYVHDVFYFKRYSTFGIIHLVIWLTVRLIVAI